MKKNAFINLPSIEKIEVKEYLLFKETWSYSVKRGLNLFVGANGLGKTTTANLIIYGLVGITSSLTEEYFSERKGGITDESSIVLDFVINNKKYHIERALKGAILKKFKIDKKELPLETYNKKILDDIGLNNVDDLIFLLEKFLIREEEGNYLLWDHNEQYRLLQLLINTKNFKRDYDKLSRKYLDKEKEYKAKSEQKRKPTLKRLENFKREKNREIEKRQNLENLTKLEKELESKKEKVQELLNEKTSLKNKLNYLSETNAKIQSEMFDLESNLEQFQFQNSKIEKSLYKHIYSDNTIQHSVHKLKYYDLCIFCNKKISSEKSSKIVQKIEIKCECPVCDSKLKNDGTEEIKNPEKLLERININTEESNSIKKRLLIINKQIPSIKSENDSVSVKFNDISKKISNLNIEILELENNILFLSNSDHSASNFDILIKECEKELEQFKIEFVKIDEDKKKIEKSLESMNKAQAKLQESILEELNKVFQKYSSRYFFKDASLVLNEKIGEKSKKAIKYFIPKFEDKKRYFQKSCSTSQRIILEYLFRVALIELYHKESGHIPFMILETSEGAFDLTSTKHLGNTINAFNASKKINCIIIANFSKEEFLSILVKGISNSKSRFKNFLDFSEVGEFQEEDQKSYDDIIKRLKLV